VTWPPVGYANTMLIAGVIALCILILILAFLFPRLSQHPQRGSQKAFGLGGRGASKAPGPLGRWLSKPFHKSSKAVGKSGSAGRRGRSKMPL
jgi:Family of unknown function (DUF6411)